MSANFGPSSATIIPVGMVNRLYNGDFTFNPAGTVTVSDTQTVFQNWYVLTQSGSIQASQLSYPENGQDACARFTQTSVTAQRYGFAQLVQAADCGDLRTALINASARLRFSQTGAVRFAVLQWSGTPDAAPLDVVADWTSALYVPGQFFISSVSVVNEGIFVSPANTWDSLPYIPFQGSGTLTNLYYFIWTDQAVPQNGTLDAGLNQVSEGATALPYEHRPAELAALLQQPSNIGVDTIASAATCDIGSKNVSVLIVTGTTQITSFGNTMLPGQSKLLYIQSTGLEIIKDTAANHTNIFLDIGIIAAGAGPQNIQYWSIAGDLIQVWCNGKTAGVCTYQARILQQNGMAPGQVALPGVGYGGAFYTTGNTTMSYFSEQFITSEFQSLIGTTNGSLAPAQAFRWVNLGNNQIAPGPLTCDISVIANPAAGTGGRDGGSLADGQAWYFYFMHDIDGSKPCIIASLNSSVPQFGVTSVLRYGAVIGTNGYDNFGGTHRLYTLEKTQTYTMIVAADPPLLTSGSNAGVFTTTTTATVIGKVIPQAMEPIILLVTGGPTGTVALAELNGDSIPVFSFTGDNTHGWAFTITMAQYGAAFRYYSTDANAKVYFKGGGDGS